MRSWQMAMRIASLSRGRRLGKVGDLVRSCLCLTLPEKHHMTSPATVWVRDRQAAASPWNGVDRTGTLPIAARTERSATLLASRASASEALVCHTVGGNLRRLRQQHRLSLEQLSAHSGVSRAMLSQVEQGRSVPSIKTLWQVAQALGVSVSWFLEPTHDDAVLLLQPSPDSPTQLPSEGAELRPLQRARDGHREAFHELRLAPGGRLSLPATVAARRVNVAVSTGVLDVILHGQRHLVRPRESLQYEATDALEWHNSCHVQVQAFVLIRTPGAQDAQG